MKPISVGTKRAVALAAVLFSAACIVNVADDVIPLIRMVDVPLADAIKTLARQSNLNYILDPHVPGSDFGPGRLAPKISITASWTNVTAQEALSALLKEHSLTMVTNPATTVTRIAPANLSVKPVPTSQVGTNTGDIIPLLAMDSVSLIEAVTQLASAASLAISLDPELSATDFDTHGTVSFRWERITARQALAALLDNYDLVMIEDRATSAARITQKSTATDRAGGTPSYAMPKKGTPNQPDAGDAKYEIVLEGEKVVFDKAESVAIWIVIRNLGTKKLIALDLISGLSVVWDGKEYKCAKFSWNGPYEIIPKGYLRTGFSLSDCLVPAEVLTAGRHTIALKDAVAESNTLTVFIERSSANRAVREAHEKAASAGDAAAGETNAASKYVATITKLLPKNWGIKGLTSNAVPYNLGIKPDQRRGTRIELVGTSVVKGPRGINNEKESFILWIMSADYTPIPPDTVAQFEEAKLLGSNETVAVYCTSFTTGTPSWTTWKQDIVKHLTLSNGKSVSAIKPEHSPYEIVLGGEKVVFDKAETVSSPIVIRDLGVKKMIAPDLYWGLSVVWDGKEYKRDPKHIGMWNGPWEIMPKTAWRTIFSLSEYLVPAEVLTVGRHTIALRDAFAESNTLTVSIEPKNR